MDILLCRSYKTYANNVPGLQTCSWRFIRIQYFASQRDRSAQRLLTDRPIRIAYFERTKGVLYIIDVSQSVEHDHPFALDFLRFDCRIEKDTFLVRWTY